VQAWYKSGSIKGHFNREAERVFRPYLAFHCSGVAEELHVTLPPHAPKLVQYWLKSGTNKGHFTFLTERFARTCLASILARESNYTHGTPSPFAKTSANFLEIGQ
jgi:hypothetical protein